MSSGFLLDTSFLSELSPGRKALPSTVSAWVLEHFPRFYLSTISVAEVVAGIAKLRRTGPSRRAAAYEMWLEQSLAIFGEQLLGFDPLMARAAGELTDRAIAIGRHPGFPDIAIAATARVQDLAILTRNIRHFQPLGIDCLDPFEAA